MYGAETLQVTARGALEQTPEQLRNALQHIVAPARAAGLIVGPRDVSPVDVEASRDGSRAPAAGGDTSRAAALAPEGAWDGHLAAEPDGRFTIVHRGLRRAAEGARLPAGRASGAARAA